jgi:hypothetical protein
LECLSSVTGEGATGDVMKCKG